MIAMMVLLAVAFGFVVLLPLLLVTTVLRVALGLVFLPFKLLGGVFRLGFGLFGGLLKVGFGAAGLLAFVVGALFCVVLLPLLPFLIVGAMVWAFFSLLAGPRTVRVIR